MSLLSPSRKLAAQNRRIAIGTYQERVETVGIGTRAQTDLHRALVAWAAGDTGRIEVEMDGSVIDAVRGETLIEVQTSSLGAIRPKLERLVEEHPVRLVHPRSARKWLRCYAAEGDEILWERRSPKKESYLDAFGELVYIPKLLKHPNFELELVLVERRELRCNDGQGSWRRKGISIVGQELVQVLESRRFASPNDLASLLPPTLDDPFSVSALAKAAGIRNRLAGRMAYTLYKAGALERVGKRGKAYLYGRVDET